MRISFIAFLMLGPLGAGAWAAPGKAPAASPPPPSEQHVGPKTVPAKKGKKIYPAQKRPKLKREDFKLQATMKNPDGFKIEPKNQVKQPAAMTLRKHAVRPGILVLELKVRDPKLMLSRKTAVVQLYPEEEVELEKEIFVNEEWPKTDLVEVGYKILKPGGPYLVQGEGAFTLCQKNSKVCESKIIPFAVELP
ncbi:MAG: hypothetical protein IT285_14805 [Bdellovibrionales bacterium]|nr:hypothetical protein [Bdellovibrionales bacterium]